MNERARWYTRRMTLAVAELVAFLATTDAERAKAFYRDTLGLTLLADDPFALVFDANGTRLRMQKVPQHQPLPFTALGFEVASIAAAVAALTQKGVRFERFPGMDQDPSGVWSAPSGAKVAWFKDPDGNLLSVNQ
jgi:catechol 2,3-dioxygenase-like lactoylglutathione lyase family enzyme